MNEFTEQLFVGTTMNIKETLKNHSDIFEGLGNEGETVLHTLCILHIESRYLNQKTLKMNIEKSLFDNGYAVWSKTKKNIESFKEKEIEDLITTISIYQGWQDEMWYFDAMFDFFIDSGESPSESFTKEYEIFNNKYYKWE